MTITVQGIGVVGGFGCGVQALAEALGRTPGGRTPDGRTPDGLERRADPAPLDRFVPRRGQRRLDPLARITALAAHLALEDAGLPPAQWERLGVVVASGYGATGTTLAMIDSIIEGGDACTSPIHFAGSLHNAPAAHLAMLLGAKGPNLTVSQFHLSVPSALMAAKLWLDQGRVERVLFGGVDELSELIAYLWSRRDEMERPLGPPGVPCGEGAAFVLLSARAEARAPYCSLEWASTGQGPPPDLGDPGQVLRAGDLTPLVGCMPAAPAFDLAAAAIRLRAEGGPERVTCLTFDGSGGYGVARLGAPRTLGNLGPPAG